MNLKTGVVPNSNLMLYSGYSTTKLNRRDFHQKTVAQEGKCRSQHFNKRDLTASVDDNKYIGTY